MFRKYPSLINHYQMKAINDATLTCRSKSFVIQEKLDGANFQLYITNDDVVFGKRNSLLGDNASFFNFQQAVAKRQAEITRIQQSLKDNPYADSYIVYGELFGGNTQTRVSYQEDRDIKIFDIVIVRDKTEYSMPWHSVELFAQCHDFEDMLVPVFGYTDTLEEALGFDVENRETLVGDDEYNPYNNKGIEGVTIRPADECALDYRIKKKSKAFADKAGVKAPKQYDPSSDECKEITSLFEGYINTNRVADYFSKEGVIESPSQIGDYIRGILADAKEDFFKDHKEPFLQLDDKEKKRVFSPASKLILNFLKEKL